MFNVKTFFSVNILAMHSFYNHCLQHSVFNKKIRNYWAAMKKIDKLKDIFIKRES